MSDFFALNLEQILILYDHIHTTYIISKVIKYPQCSLNITQSYFFSFMQVSLTSPTHSPCLHQTDHETDWLHSWLHSSFSEKWALILWVRQPCYAEPKASNMGQTQGNREVAWTENAAQL